MNYKEKIFSGKPLAGKTVLLTGGGGGIGFEAAKDFVEMGASVLIAEIDEEKGIGASDYLNAMRPGSSEFYKVDLSEEQQINSLYQKVTARYQGPDILFHNAAVVSIGSIDEMDTASWDKGYKVNLRAPFLLTRLFLPHMVKRNSGTVVFVSSSGAAPYMAAYEVFKTAQVELSGTLALELEQKGVYSYVIGPGLVKTQTAVDSIEIIASSMGMTTEEFYEMNESHILDPESAGLGFALSVLKAGEYHGQEISSIQVLNDFKISDPDRKTGAGVSSIINPADFSELLGKIVSTYDRQYSGWKNMNVFERQWVLRDFKKSMGMAADAAYSKLHDLLEQTDAGSFSPQVQAAALLEKLLAYWQHQYKLLQGYEKDPARLADNSASIREWIADIEKMLLLLKKGN